MLFHSNKRKRPPHSEEAEWGRQHHWKGGGEKAPLPTFGGAAFLLLVWVVVLPKRGGGQKKEEAKSLQPKGSRGKPHHPKEETGKSAPSLERRRKAAPLKGEENFSLSSSFVGRWCLLPVAAIPSSFWWCCLPPPLVGGAAFLCFLWIARPFSFLEWNVMTLTWIPFTSPYDGGSLLPPRSVVVCSHRPLLACTLWKRQVSNMVFRVSYFHGVRVLLQIWPGM